MRVIDTWIVDSQAGMSTIIMAGVVVRGVRLVEDDRRVARGLSSIPHDPDTLIGVLGFMVFPKALPELDQEHDMQACSRCEDSAQCQ